MLAIIKSQEKSLERILPKSPQEEPTLTTSLLCAQIHCCKRKNTGLGIKITMVISIHLWESYSSLGVMHKTRKLSRI